MYMIIQLGYKKENDFKVLFHNFQMSSALKKQARLHVRQNKQSLKMIIVWFLTNRALRKKENANSKKNKKGHMKR